MSLLKHGKEVTLWNQFWYEANTVIRKWNAAEVDMPVWLLCVYLIDKQQCALHGFANSCGSGTSY